MGSLLNYIGLKKKAEEQTQQSVDNAIQQPQIDTSDPINSLAGMLVTPAEREAQEQKMLRNKRRMIGWTGFFDGLRNLANLWAVSKGAAPQKYTDNPYQQIEKDYQAERQRQNSLYDYKDKYATTLWNLKRQGLEDARKNALAAAQAKWYDTREEAAQQKTELDRQKAELDKLKAVRVIKNKDGSLMKFDPITGTVEQLSEADPLYVQYMKSNIGLKNAQIAKTNRTGGSGTGTGRSNGTYGYRTVKHVDPATGDVITERIPTTGGQPETKVQPAKGKTTQKVKRKSRTTI